VALQAWWKINRWLIIGVLALAIAVYAGLRVMALRPQQAVPTQTTVPVFVVSQPVPADSPLLANDVVERAYPINLIPPGAFRGSIVGEYTTEALQPGEVLLANQLFVPATSDLIASRLPPGDVAFDLSLSAQSEVDGVISPGDHVTILETLGPGMPGAGSAGETRVFLQHVDVLAVNGALTGPATPGAGEQLILAVPLVDAEALTFAEQHAPLTLVLERPDAHLGTVAPYGPTWPVAPAQP
jgi:Flp pilus assembly protein CpaB